MSKRPLLLAALACAAFTFLVFAPSLSFGFLPGWDDGYLLNNRAIRGLDAEHVRAIFSFAHNEASLRYQPINYLLWAVNYRLSGLAPFSYHFSNVLLHALNAGLLCALLGLFLDGVPARRGALAAGAAALLWSLHPLRVEAVAWAVARGHALSLFFLLLAALARLRGARWYPASLAAAALAVLSYPAAIGGCAALALTGGWKKKELPGKLPYLAIAVLGALAAAATRYGGNGPWDKPPEMGALGFAAQALRACWAWSDYVWRAWKPFGLSPFYVILVNRPPFHWTYFAHAGVLISITAAAWLVRKKHPAALLLWLGYGVAAFPFVGFSEGVFVANDRYTYVPGVFWSFVAAWALSRERAKELRVVSAAALGLLVWRTLAEQPRWRDEVVFYEALAADLKGDPYESIADWRLGAAYLRTGDGPRAAAALDRAIELVPGEPTALGLRGQYRLSIGDYKGAEADLEASLKARPRPELSASLAEAKLRAKAAKTRR